MTAPPTIQPNSQPIRVYARDYARSETSESSFETFATGDGEHLSDDEESEDDLETRLVDHQTYLNRQTWVTDPPQTVETVHGVAHGVVLVRKPTASNIFHEALNPYVYRQVQDAGSLDDLATLLKAPVDWRQSYATVEAIPACNTQFEFFCGLPEETPETDVQSGFESLVHTSLGISVFHRSEKKIIVGGLLAYGQYDARGSTDSYFLHTDLNVWLASEVKNASTFSDRDMWYRSSRGVQVLSALYAHNCPTFLLTQKHWKLFLENEERNSVLTFPYREDGRGASHVRSCRVAQMDADFIKAIVI